MKRLTIAIIVALSSLSAIAQSAWEEGNKAYADANFEEAIINYENLLQDPAILGDAKAEVYYNLGNAYFKTGENARAILAYERCLRLNPHHQDAAFNLRFAQSRIIDNIEDHHHFFLMQWAQALRSCLPESTWLLGSVILFVLCLVGMLIFAIVQAPALRKTAFYSGVALFLLSIIFIGNGLSLHHRDMAQEEAIILQGIVNAKSAPDKSGTDLFVLHEGTKVRVGDTVGDWCEIIVGDNVGWIRLNALERI